jgi:protein phosphatase
VRGTPLYIATRLTPAARDQARWRGGFEAGFVSERGVARARNEDACSCSPTLERPVFCGVADGVGGGAHGDLASRVLLEHCADAPRKTYRNPARLSDWIVRADAKVRQAVAAHTTRPGAATLAAMWLVARGKVHVVHVGDCRVYRVRRRDAGCVVEQMTTDQTYANVGQEVPLDASPHDPARMVGVGAVGRPPVVSARIREGDMLLLCSDGIHKYVSDEEIAAIVERGVSSNASLDSICSALLGTAKLNGSDDDASALLVRRRSWFGVRGTYWCAAAALALLCTASAFAFS